MLNRKGAGIYEIIALVILLAAAWAGDAVGSRYSNIAGIVGMVLFPLALVFLIEKLAWLERELSLGQKPYPLCPCGKCSIDSLPEAEPGEQPLRRCQCGRTYDTSGRGIIRIVENGAAKDFATWKPFKGWQQN
ncbi:MAG: hypothetical protein PHD82_15500 [Candidatus Riflebacteria bacterium]|jgi:hypothetical protein|nr:hypothetical protein [Candidatus Riflebacteria bacterium]